MDEMQEIIKDFIVEARENLDRIDSSVITLENDPHNEEILNTVFRCMHTIKGAAGFLGFEKVQKLSHNTEDLLNRLRKKEIILNPQITDVLLASVDILKKLIKEIEKDGKEISEIDSGINLLTLILEAKKINVHKQDTQEMVDTVVVKSASTEPSDIIADAPSSAGPAIKHGFTNGLDISSNTIRIDIEKLDVLMNLAGELVLARNRQGQVARDAAIRYPHDEVMNSAISSAVHQMDMLTSEVQVAVMKARMLPVSTLFDKFTRIVRDMVRGIGKEADIVISGRETEIDKNILEELADPMVHLIRNAVDHGIEPPDERVRNGKDRKGVIQLSAYHEGGYVVIRIKDDGKGMNPSVIKNKAVEKGVITSADADKLTDKEALNLIFAPGFSTAEKVTSISGRGVGMDVVKTHIEKLKGIIEVDSMLHKGTTIRLLIPLTLAILQSLLCKVGTQRFAIPLVYIKETLTILSSDIVSIKGRDVIRLRDEILPVFRLKDILETPSAEKDISSVIILQLGSKRIALLVDETIGKEEVVVKSLTCLDKIFMPDHISGATILGDGIVTMILDVESIIRLASKSGSKMERLEREVVVSELKEEEQERMLIVDDGGAEQYAIPHRFIKNVEFMDVKEIECIGNKEVIKYDGEIMPVTSIYHIIKYPPAKRLESVYVVVVSDGAKRGGIIVNNMKGLKWIKRADIKDSLKDNKAIAGSTILDKKVTIILDNRVVIDSIYSEDVQRAIVQDISGASVQEDSKTSNAGRKTILLVDDSSTHRSIQGKFVQGEGYDVVYAEDGEDGLGKLSNIDLVLTDLEMPKMNGYEFTKRVKAINPNIPVIMLTSRGGEEDRRKGLESGVDDYLVKLDKVNLIQTIKKYIG